MLTTPNFLLQYIDVNEAQREVVHNSAVRALDALVQLSVLDRDLATPPGSPSDGERWLVAASPTGAWTGHATHIAAWQDGAWRFYVPQIGWLVFVTDEGALLAWNGSAWIDALSMVTSLQNIALLGIGTTADSSNPLSAKLNNTLWVAKTVAEGGDGNLRYTLSKESSSKTLSLLFQDNFSGRAEIGLTGDDDFHFKVSPNGTSWFDGLILSQTAAGCVVKIPGALQCERTANAFNTASIYTAFVIGELSGSDAANGGLYACARYHKANAPFTALSGWDNGASRALYFGGGGWGVPDATYITFYVAPAYNETPDTGVVAMDIDGASALITCYSGFQLLVDDTRASTSTTTGALVVTGGAGIGGKANIGGALKVADSTAASSTSTGSIVGAGGLGIAGKAYVGGGLNVAGGGAVYNSATGGDKGAGTVNVASAYYINGVKFGPPVTYQATPSNPTGTTSTTQVMAGLAGAITPGNSGKVFVFVTAEAAENTNARGVSMQIRYGTGTAPTNGAAATGTAIGHIARMDQSASTIKSSLTCHAIVTGLTPGTAYWIDVGFNTEGAGTANLTGVGISAFEM